MSLNLNQLHYSDTSVEANLLQDENFYLDTLFIWLMIFLYYTTYYLHG